MRSLIAGWCLAWTASSLANNFTELQSLVWQRDAVVISAQSRVDASEHAAASNRRLFNDGASLNVSELRNNNERSLYEQEWELNLPAIWTSSALQHSKRVEAAIATTQLLMAQISASADLYRELGTAKVLRQLTALQQQRSETAEALLHDMERRMRAGESAPNDVTQLRIEWQSALNDWQRSDMELSDLRLQLQAKTGVAINLDTVVLPTITTATDTHPLLKLAQQEQQHAQAQREWANDWSRHLNWRLLYKKTRSELDGVIDSSTGIGLSIPLGSDAEHRDERVQAMYAAQAAQTHLQVVQQQLPLQQQRAELKRQQAQQYWQHSQQIAQWQSEHSAAVDKAWRQGEMAFADALRAREKSWQSRIHVLLAQRAVIDAEADYLLASGVLP